jgi:beta-glucosidase
MPVRAMAKFSNGIVSKKMTEDILFMINGHFWRGLGRLIVDFFKNLKKASAFNKALKEADDQ